MQPTSSKKEIWTMGTYSLLTLSIMVGFMYLNTFATEVLKIPAATLATALLIAKICDFIVSLFCGVIVEKVRLGKKGKNQSWLYYGRWILAVMIMLEVANTSTAPMVVRVVVLGVSYTVLNCLMNIIQTAYYGIVAVVAGPNPANRNAMTINMIRQNTVVMLICSFIPTLVTKLPFGSWNYFIVALVFMLPIPWALGNISRLAEGKDLPVGQGPAGAPRVSVKDMLESLFKNPQLLALFISFTVLQIGMFMYQANYTYYFIYVIGDFTKLTLATLAASLVGVVAAMFMPKIGTRIGKKWSCVAGFMLFGGHKPDGRPALGMVYPLHELRHLWYLYLLFLPGHNVSGLRRMVPEQDRQGYADHRHRPGLSPDEDRHGPGRHRRSVSSERHRLRSGLHPGRSLGQELHVHLLDRPCHHLFRSGRHHGFLL